MTTPAPSPPFIDVPTFTDWFRPLSGPESERAGPYLQVVSDWIRDHKPLVADDDAAAQLVTFEVTREALLYGEFEPLGSFSKTVGPRSKSGTFDRTSVDRLVTGRHRRMLGIPLRAEPRGHFKRCDY